MQTKTKYVAIAVGISLSMALLSTCQGPKEAPKDPKAAVQATALFECSGALNYLAVNTPGMPDDYRTDHQTLASAIAEGARAMKTGVDEVEPYDAGTKRAKKLLDAGDTKGIVQVLEQCAFNAKDILSKEQTQAEQLKPEDMPRNDSRDPLLEEKERQAALEAELQKEREEKQRITAYSQQMYVCSGIFAFSAELQGLTQDLKMMYGNASAVAWKMAHQIDPNVEGTEFGLKGAQQVQKYMKANDSAGLKERFQDCMDTADYIREKNIGNLGQAK